MPISVNNRRPYGGAAVYSRITFAEGYPYSHSIDGIEFTILKVTGNQDLTVIGAYRSPNIPITHLCSPLTDILREHRSQKNVILGDFNVSWMVDSQRQSIYNVMVEDNVYRQLISRCTTDSKTIIDHYIQL